MAEHTRLPSNLPWSIGRNDRIIDCKGNTVADCRYRADQTIPIVCVVNREPAFEAMREALEGCLAIIDVGIDTGTFELAGSLAAIPQQARAALKKAGIE